MLSRNLSLTAAQYTTVNLKMGILDTHHHQCYCLDTGRPHHQSSLMVQHLAGARMVYSSADSAIVTAARWLHWKRGRTSSLAEQCITVNFA